MVVAVLVGVLDHDGDTVGVLVAVLVFVGVDDLVVVADLVGVLDHVGVTVYVGIVTGKQIGRAHV